MPPVTIWKFDKKYNLINKQTGVISNLGSNFYPWGIETNRDSLQVVYGDKLSLSGARVYTLNKNNYAIAGSFSVDTNSTGITTDGDNFILSHGSGFNVYDKKGNLIRLLGTGLTNLQGLTFNGLNVVATSSTGSVFHVFEPKNFNQTSLIVPPTVAPGTGLSNDYKNLIAVGGKTFRVFDYKGNFIKAVLPTSISLDDTLLDFCTDREFIYAVGYSTFDEG